MKPMKIVKIAKETFEAFEMKAKVKYLNDMSIELGSTSTQIQIGDKIFVDRESLQYWQIENGFML
jgi:hypothetical protein